ncbi:MAG: septum site-determining protein MinC [Burkholderiales bacterium]
MTVAFPGRTPVAFEIKSANLPLVALLLKSPDLDLLSQELDDRFAGSASFFDNDPVVIDLSLLGDDPAPVEFGRLLTILRRWKMAPIAFKGAGALHAAAARAAGLVAAPDAELHRGTASGGTGAAAGSPTPPSASPKQSDGATGTAAKATREAARNAAPAELQGAMVVYKQVRSGQQVYAKGRDLVVLSAVNQGAEVIADGHVHVYGTLRGKAIAGARGDADARIFAIGMEAELIAIAGTYRTSETPLPPEVFGRPTQIRLVGDKLLMEPLAD